MAALDLQEQEQLADLKAWWDKRGNLVLSTIIVICLVIAGYNGWRYYQRSQAMSAGAVFDQLQAAAAAGDKVKTRDAAGTLLASYGGSSYAPLGALIAARTLFDAGEVQTAKAQLQWVIDNSRDDELKHVARVRLAGLLLDEKQYDEGLRVLDATRPAHFDAIYLDRRGDLLLAQGKNADARTAWQDALVKADTKGALRGSLQLKIELASSVPSAAAPAAAGKPAATGAPSSVAPATATSVAPAAAAAVAPPAEKSPAAPAK